MNTNPPHPAPTLRQSSEVLRLGFVPLVHAAPLVVAQEHGFFRRHGLRVRLHREVGWATIREKILSGELDAAQAVAPMPLAITLGLNSVRGDCLTALVLNRHGNTVVLSRRLWRATAGRLPAGSGQPLTFGIVYPHSAQRFVLQGWLDVLGLQAERDYRLVVVPPQQVVGHLEAGHLDGACVGEPWGSLAVRAGVGIVAALSADLAPGHPEKVLMVRASFAQQKPGEHLALAAALLEACAWCARTENHEELIRLLAHRNAVGAPAEAIRPAVTGSFDLGDGRGAHRPDVLRFHGDGVNEPSADTAAWIASHLEPATRPEILSRVFRADLFRDVTRLTSLPSAPVNPTTTAHESSKLLAPAA